MNFCYSDSAFLMTAVGATIFFYTPTLNKNNEFESLSWSRWTDVFHH